MQLEGSLANRFTKSCWLADVFFLGFVAAACLSHVSGIAATREPSKPWIQPIEVELITDLLFVDPRKPDWQVDPEWDLFREYLSEAKTLGVAGISVDVWWGLVQATSEKEFDWTYYDRVFQEIIAAKLQIVPILFAH